ncbi:MAG TPA: RHS repeat-associated core domain-containing protein [Woeseiaceae bacterium]|nr:RHS repeat-associated core domain-containing protein [Woeseiaceae bacterium]
MKLYSRAAVSLLLFILLGGTQAAHAQTTGLEYEPQSYEPESTQPESDEPEIYEPEVYQPEIYEPEVYETEVYESDNYAPELYEVEPPLADSEPSDNEVPPVHEEVPPESDTNVGTTAAFVGGGGGAPLEFNVSILEPQIPDRYPGSTALGDGYNPATGEVTFSVVDISIPGNSAIPVELRRWIPTSDSDTGGPTGWKWDIPHIKGNYLEMKPGHNATGWDWGTTTWHYGENCTGDSDAVLTADGNLIASNMYWEGKLLHIPDVTSEKFLKTATGTQVTKSNFKVSSCITTNPSGQQGIVVVGPNGLKYTFNQIKSYFNGKDTLKDPNTMTRILLVTKIEDRFGGYVNYTYDASSNLTQILANDGRKIVIAYQSVSGKLRPTTATVDNNAPTADRTWTYNYQTTGGKYLQSVTLPDASQWQYTGLNIFNFDPNDPVGVYNYNINRNVGNGAPYWAPACGASATNQYATVTTPDGAVIAYTFRETFHNRSDVEPAVLWGMQTGYDGQARNLHCTVSLSLTNRTVSGPGIPTMQWSYSYSQNQGNYNSMSNMNQFLTGQFDLLPPAYGFPSMINSVTDIDYRSVTINGPDKRTVFYINRKFQSLTEGMVVAEDTVEPSTSTLIERTEKTFVQGAFVGNHWYKCPCGGEYPPSNAVNAYQLNYRINQTKSDLFQYKPASERYTTTYSVFNANGTPTLIGENNSLGSNTRYTLTDYRDGASAWILDQPYQTRVSATASNYTTTEYQYFDTLDRPTTHHRFGRYDNKVASYHADGNVNRVEQNATNRWHEYSNYKRGIAQTIKTPQSLSTTPQYAYIVVDDNGWKTKITDYVGNVTNYAYDPLGRLTLIDPVNTAWTNTTFAYSKTTGSEGLSNIVAGMPKRTKTRGSFKETMYFDALMRPVLVKQEDTAKSLVRFVKKAYNASSNVVFQSYPSFSSGSTTNGVVTRYDALQRVIEVDENTSPGSEVYTYLYGNKVQLNNARGYITTTTYLAYGSPSTSAPVLIAQPEGVSTSMAYDIFGNMTSASQGGITQSNVYDAYKNLCKIVRPDSGNEAFLVDAIGQVSWTAHGSSVDSLTTSCDTTVTAADQTVNTYDNLGNLKLVNYGDSSPDITTTYNKNSLPLTMAAGSVVTTYGYNSANLLSSESLAVDSQTFNVTYGYNGLGHLSSLTYPTAVVVDFAPNAFGEATKAGTYASSVGYHANGSIATLTYGNSRIYTTTQNSRQLPEDLKVMSGGTTIANLRYLYDDNANITTITDYVTSSANRAMTYDGLDRLKTASGIWGAGSYTYDVLGNIKTKTEGGQGMTYTYNTSLNRLTSITGANARTFSYDTRGNVTNNGTQGFTYNLAGNLVSSTVPTITYAYDGHKRRVKKTEGTQTSYSLYSSSGKLLHKKAGGVSTDYIYAGSLLVAEKAGSTVNYLHTDLLGSPIAGSNGTSYTEHYRPWGEKWNNPIQLANDVGFTGHQHDVATNLTYMQARYYDDVVGRFMAVDPVGFSAGNPMSFNRYAYANDNPYRFTDPDGRESVGQMIDSAADGCGAVSCAGWAVANAVWTVFGAESVSQIADRGVSDASSGDLVSAALEVAGALPPARIVGKVASATKSAVRNVSKGLPKPRTGPGMVPKSERDPKRLFTPKERDAKRVEQGNKCGNACGTDIDASNSAGHHIDRHADGGRTVPENHAEVCNPCHEILHSRD